MQLVIVNTVQDVWLKQMVQPFVLVLKIAQLSENPCVAPIMSHTRTTVKCVVKCAKLVKLEN